jgi:hypothetical protein
MHTDLDPWCQYGIKPQCRVFQCRVFQRGYVACLHQVVHQVVYQVVYKAPL